MRPEPYVPEPGDDEESARAYRIALHGVSASGATLFLPGPGEDVHVAWSAWLHDWFSPAVAPCFTNAYTRARDFRIREVTDVDRRFDSSLSEALRIRSLRSATAFREGKHGMLHHSHWKKFVRYIEEGETPGHVPVMAALQAALFHLPLGSALLAYTRFEYRGGLHASGQSPAEDAESDGFDSAIPHLRVAVSRSLGDTAGGEEATGTSLRAL